MRKFNWNALVILCSLSLTMFFVDYTCENNALGAENEVFQIPEELLLQKVVWEKCELIETKKRLRKAECTDITVPLYWDNPEGGTMTIRVKRLKSLLKATKQLWCLEGGPGPAGTFTLPETLMKPLAQRDWRTDFYALDHRGSGHSDRLSCPEQEADDSEKGIELSASEGGACIEYLEANYNLGAFTVTQAAKDVGFLVELLKEEDKEIFVYGRSYGTYWGHRYAKIFPDQAVGIILDSVVPSVFQGDQWDINGNDVVKDFFDICKEDEFCRNKMGDDPWGKATEIFDNFKDGHCADVVENGLTPELLQDLALNALDFLDFRIILPVLYYRINRCSEEDVRAFKHFLDNFLSSFPPLTADTWSDPLRYHIALSELFSNPMSAEECKEIDTTLLATEHLACNALQLLEKPWPTYETDQYYHEWASEDVPILMLNGTLDRATPIDIASTASENLTGPNQYFVVVPNANHVVIMNSPVKNIFAPHCGMQIVLDYMENPLAEPDTSCIDELVPIDFRGNPLMSLLVFGTLDLWENGINAGLD